MESENMDIFEKKILAACLKHNTAPYVVSNKKLVVFGSKKDD